MATRQLSCPGKSSAEKLLKHQNTPPQPIGELVKDIPEELAKLIHRMLAKKREDRPQTPAEVAEDLRLFRDKAGVEAFQINYSGCENLGQMLKSMELLMTEVRPLVDGA